MSTEEEDEFEDALDSLPTEVDLRSPSRRLHLDSTPQSIPMTSPSSSAVSHVPSIPDGSNTPSSMRPPAPPISPRRPETIGIATPSMGATPVDQTMSARQERLANLRRRLRDEFGHTTRGRTPSNNCEMSDSVSLASDSASLHSWHHSLLVNSHCSVVRAADTMSTRASSNYGQFSPSPSSPPPSMPPPPRLAASVPPSVPLSLPPPLPPRPASIRLPDPVAAEVLARIEEAEREKTANKGLNLDMDIEVDDGDRSRDIEETLVMRNEHTLLATSHSSSDVFSSPSTSFSLQNPPSTSPRLRGRSKSTREDEKEKEGMERKSSMHNTSSESMQQQQSSTNSSGATISEATKPPVGVHPLQPLSSERRRGHTKTNSLDRGLTLAKSIKTGPFPPPSSKSNSLTRGQAGPNFEGEEEERNSLADRVIQQLTTSVIGEGAIVVEDDLEKRRPSQLGAIPSCSSSSPSSSASSTVSSRGDKRGKGRKEEEKNGRRKEERTRKKEALSVVKESPEHAGSPSLDITQADSDEERRSGRLGMTLPRDTLSPLRSPLGVTVGSSKSLPLNDRTLGSRLGEWADIEDKHSPDASYDPITRDVERRMSMKGHGQMGGMDGGLRGDGEETDSTSIAGSTLSSAGTAVKEMATGLIRGVISRARSALNATSSASSKAAAESEMSESDSEMDDPSESASVAGRHSAASSSTNASIVRPRNAKKGPFDFAEMRVVQEITNEHTGAVWCVKFSICGRLMATAGHDTIIRVWCVRSGLSFFNNMRAKYQQKRGSAASSTNTSFEAFDRTMGVDLESDLASSYKPASSDAGDSLDEGGSGEEGETSLFATKPFAVFKGHTADVLDLSWSKNYFVLSSGMDRTVKLWHLSRSECLCCFQHVDFVTCVSFLPKDDRYFLSGSLDGKLRMWHIPDKKVAVWNEVGVKFITALAFAKSGKFAVVGTYNGKCYFYSTEQLKYHTVVDVRSTRGKNARGHKVTGLAVHGDKLLVTSNDSRIRMYDVRDKALTCKFKGAQNDRSQIRAHFSPDGKHIVCGSEDRYVYIWRTSDLPSSLSVRKDRNAQWERVRAHTVPVSVACFAPKPNIFLAQMERAENARRRGQNDSYREASSSWSIDASSPPQGDVIISADLSGCIKIMVNRAKPVKLGQSTFFSQ
ncbi:hypothetical protein PMAYCL1PPCAC_02564 [Pristionchus mayeri]|uniref:WD repeat-containing protein 44 n=1 Tax=Pristionchus mayeri TaxID=1317129 RepID=A0AAN4Z367_9BILA|nr:hypothetical protein PMAYCL1PPCAC_02564 [Pristionchus mayeri]